MSSTIQCPVCKQWFDSMDSYLSHSCDEVKIYGGVSDLRQASEELHDTRGGTGEYD